MYKILICKQINRATILISNSHDHEVKTRYNNIHGIDIYYKNIIESVVKLGITEPKRIRCHLHNLEDAQLSYNEIDALVGNNEVGDLIPKPKYKQIISYIGKSIFN